MSEYNDAPEERARVYGRIAPLIMDFYHDNIGRQFSAEQLRRYVLSFAPDVAPDSPGRILRELRLEGRLDYVVINRRQSLYQFRNMFFRRDNGAAKIRSARLPAARGDDTLRERQPYFRSADGRRQDGDRADRGLGDDH